MREILFRGKHIHLFPQNEHLNETWVYGYLCDKNYINSPGLNGELLVDPSTVGQYTGLVDKNGKRIFEGDVVSQIWYDYEEPRDTSFGEVVYCEYDCSFSVMDDEKDGIVPLGSCAAYVWEVEVIGNIHDNPELLEEA